MLVKNDDTCNIRSTYYPKHISKYAENWLPTDEAYQNQVKQTRGFRKQYFNKLYFLAEVTADAPAGKGGANAETMKNRCERLLSLDHNIMARRAVKNITDAYNYWKTIREEELNPTYAENKRL